MVTIDDLQRMALELESVNKTLERVSHYKVNRKIYELMKSIKHVDINYYPRLNMLTLNSNPVFIDDELSDGIATYNHKDLVDNKPVHIYSANMMTISPRCIKPIVFIDAI